MFFKKVNYIVIFLTIMVPLSNVFSQEIKSPGSVEIEESKKSKTEPPGSFLKIGTMIQSRIMGGEIDSLYALEKDYDSLDFNFRRIRLYTFFQGDSWWGGVVYLNLENMLLKPYLVQQTNSMNSVDVITNVTLQDSASYIEFANLWIKTPLPESKITLGIFKLPFLREMLTSSGKLIFPERGLATTTLQIYDIGILYTLNPLGFFGDRFKYMATLDLSLTNGDGGGTEGVGLKSVEANISGEPISPLWNARLTFNPLGSFMTGEKKTAWVGGNEIFQNKTLLSIGVAGLYTKAAEGGKVAYGKEYAAGTFDVVFFTQGLYLSLDVTKHFLDASSGDNLAGVASIGYIFPIAKIHLMPALRYNYYHQDSNQNLLIENSESLHDIWMGVNIFAQEHAFKAQLFYRLALDSLGAGGINKKDDVIYFMAQMEIAKTAY